MAYVVGCVAGVVLECEGVGGGGGTDRVGRVVFSVGGVVSVEVVEAMKYRQKVNVWVVVEGNKKDVKAEAESGVRNAIRFGYREGEWARWGDAWEGFAFQASGEPVKYDDGADDE